MEILGWDEEHVDPNSLIHKQCFHNTSITFLRGSVIFLFGVHCGYLHIYTPYLSSSIFAHGGTRFSRCLVSLKPHISPSFRRVADPSFWGNTSQNTCLAFVKGTGVAQSTEVSWWRPPEMLGCPTDLAHDLQRQVAAFQDLLLSPEAEDLSIKKSHAGC